MIFDWQEKQFKAEFLKLPHSTFFKMSYAEYLELCRDFENFKIKAEKWFGENCEYEADITMGNIWSKYYNICLENKVITGLEKWLNYGK